MRQQIRISTVIGALLYIFTSHTFAKCVNDYTTSANLNSILLKCHSNKKPDKSCESQLMINIYISPSFNVENLEKYLVLDEAYEPMKQTSVKIMSPYLIVINRAEPIIMYPLQYEKTISVDKNMQWPANVNITKCRSEISSSESKWQQPMFLKDNKNKHRKQRHTQDANDLIRKRFNTLHKNKKIEADVSKSDGTYTKNLNENILTKMGFIRILESPQNDPEYSSTTLLPELKYSHDEEKLPEKEQDEVKIEKPYLENQNYSQLKKYIGQYDISPTEVEEEIVNPKAFKIKKKKLKTKTKKKEWFTDYYEPFNKPNVYEQPVEFNEPKMYAKQIHHLNNQKINEKPARINYKKSKSNRKNEWMTEYYDHDNFLDSLLPTAEESWQPTRMYSLSSASKRLNKDGFNENALNYEKGKTSKYSLSKNGLSKNDLYTYNTPIFQPYSIENRIDTFNLNKNNDYNPTGAEFYKSNQNQHIGDLFSNPYSINNLKRRYSLMPSYQLTGRRKRKKRDALDYEIANLQENLYLRDNDISPCDTCGGKNKKTNGKPTFMSPSSDNDAVPCDTCGGKNKKTDAKPCFTLSAINPSKSNDIIFENVQARDNDAIPCDTCGGKNKKPGGKSLPSLSDENLQKIQDSFNENPCNCCDENIKNTYRKTGHNSCICLTNSESCSCDSSKATRSLTETSKTNSNYSVYNMSVPIPFLTTKVRIFRKRHKTWWRIAPSITLNSLAGIFANGNLSILFSTHADILELNKPLYLQNHKLVVPKCERKDVEIEENCDLKGVQNILENAFLFDSSQGDVTEFEIKKTPKSKYKKEANKNVIGIKEIADLGYFPRSLNVLQKCPNNDKRLCLNVLDDKVPAFNVKIKMPFHENAVLAQNIYKVKISKIITDATTKDALQISLDVINKGLEANEFLIYVSNCPISQTLSTKTNVKKMLLPNIGETITFLLPFTMGSKNHKYKCDVIVKAIDITSLTEPGQGDSNNSIVAKRSMDIRTHERCFCVWRCQCHCIDKLETHVNFNVCKKMGYSAEREAGLLLNCPPGNEEHDVCLMDGENDEETDVCGVLCQIIRVITAFLILLFLLGFLKAILGLCFQSINRFGFDTVQPGRVYECTSFARIFLVNIFFFIIFIFAFWCKCFKPRKEDLMVASTEWYCKPENNSENNSDTERSDSKFRLPGGSDQVYNIPDHIINAFGAPDENGLFNDDIDDDEKSTEYILRILGESKKSLSNMLIQRQNYAKLCMRSIEASSPNTKTVSVADEFVDVLTNSQIVYRVMDSPEGGITKIPQNYRYCVQGFFLRSLRSTYEFVNYHPFTQYFIVNSENNELEQLACPFHIHTNAFSRIYDSKSDVFEAGDLSIIPPSGVPCINIAHCSLLESSLCKLSTQQEQERYNEEQLSDLSEA